MVSFQVPVHVEGQVGKRPVIFEVTTWLAAQSGVRASAIQSGSRSSKRCAPFSGILCRPRVKRSLILHSLILRIGTYHARYSLQAVLLFVTKG
jgi:hypothetical protein